MNYIAAAVIVEGIAILALTVIVIRLLQKRGGKREGLTNQLLFLQQRVDLLEEIQGLHLLEPGSMVAVYGLHPETSPEARVMGRRYANIDTHIDTDIWIKK